jgi:hypothetical protein
MIMALRTVSCDPAQAATERASEVLFESASACSAAASALEAFIDDSAGGDATASLLRIDAVAPAAGERGCELVVTARQPLAKALPYDDTPSLDDNLRWLTSPSSPVAMLRAQRYRIVWREPQHNLPLPDASQIGGKTGAAEHLQNGSITGN